MRQNLLTHWGTPQERVLNAVSSLQRGGGVLVVDDDDRENEGDLIFSADSLINEQMATLIRECSGIVCLCITRDKARSLDLPQMVPKNTSSYGTAFTVSIEAAEGVTTGVSAARIGCGPSRRPLRQKPVLPTCGVLATFFLLLPGMGAFLSVRAIRR